MIPIYDYEIGGAHFLVKNDEERGIVNEIFQDKVYGEEISEGMRVVDIGANIGSFTVMAALKGASVEAFEPERDNFARLVENAALNKISVRVRASRLAVWEDSGGVTLYLHPWNIGGHSVVKDKEAGHEEVDSITLDEIAAEGPIDFLKMDCEGSEHEIIGSASDETLQKIKKMVFEYHYRDGDEAMKEKLLARLREFFTVEERPNRWDANLPYFWCTQK